MSKTQRDRRSCLRFMLGSPFVLFGLEAYDIAALVPIIEGAGGTVTNWEGGPASAGGDILAAASQTLHAETLSLLAA